MRREGRVEERFLGGGSEMEGWGFESMARLERMRARSQRAWDIISPFLKYGMTDCANSWG